MPALPVLPDVYRCAINWSAPGGQSAENVIHIYATTSTPTAVAAQLDAEVTANMLQTISGGVVASTVSITPLDGVTGTSTHPLASWIGSSAGSKWTPAAAIVLTAYTATRGRRSRGRLYLPFTDETAIDDGLLAPAPAADVAAGWNEFLTDLTASGYQPHVVSYGRPDRKNPLGWPPAKYPITSYFCNQVAGTVRRRQSRLR